MRNKSSVQSRLRYVTIDSEFQRQVFTFPASHCNIENLQLVQQYIKTSTVSKSIRTSLFIFMLLRFWKEWFSQFVDFSDKASYKYHSRNPTTILALFRQHSCVFSDFKSNLIIWGEWKSSWIFLHRGMIFRTAIYQNKFFLKAQSASWRVYFRKFAS